VHSFRIFISYHGEDEKEAEVVRAHVRRLRFTPMLAPSIAPGRHFRPEILDRIRFSHLFIPILTEHSFGRPWVNQEIGYALGVRVPVLPIAVGNIEPSGIIGDLHAIIVTNLEEELPAKLDAPTVAEAVLGAPEEFRTWFDCAEDAHERAAMLPEYAKKVARLSRGRSRIRHEGAWSSFSLPSERIDHPIWRECYGRWLETPKLRDLKHEERLALEDHALKAGYDLLIHPRFLRTRPGATAQQRLAERSARLGVLLRFLVCKPKAKSRVLLHDDKPGRSLIMVGDWFLAESRTGRTELGWLNTVYTTHAPTVLQRIREFDAVLGEAEAEGADLSREHAIEVIQGIIAEGAR
jgi:hypothetical protein